MEGKYVVLDNSTVELGAPEDLRTYVQKALAMDATAILMPDWLYEYEKTMSALVEGLPKVRAWGYKRNVMAVPQGKSVTEFMGCAAKMLEHDIQILGLSRRYTEMFGGNRTDIVKHISLLIRTSRRPWVRIHLLGCWDHPQRDIGDSLWWPMVLGIDGSLPSIFAKYSQLLEENADRPGPVIDIVNDVYDEEILKYNLLAFRRLCSGTAFGPDHLSDS